jgi:hypothetical protein
MGAISTSEDGTTSLSKMDSPRLPTVCVRRRRLPAEGGAAGDGEGEEEDTSGLRPGAAIPRRACRRGLCYSLQYPFEIQMNTANQNRIEWGKIKKKDERNDMQMPGERAAAAAGREGGRGGTAAASELAFLAVGTSGERKP